MTYQDQSSELLEAVQSQHEFANHAKQLPDSFAVVTDRLRVSLQSVLERWARLEPHDVMNDQQTELKQFTHELEGQFDGLQANSEQHEFDDELLRASTRRLEASGAWSMPWPTRKWCLTRSTGSNGPHRVLSCFDQLVHCLSHV